MYIKIHSDKKDNNRNSSHDLVNYLEKENLEKNDVLDHQKFFNQDNHDISAFTVQNSIDSNRAKLCKDESKFYMLTVNPSPVEQKHICRSISGRNIGNISQLTTRELKRLEEALKEYSRVVMNEYAKNFNRGLTGDNILYFGKIEHNRYYGRDCEEVREGLNKCDDRKEGLQTHIHIIVSRKDLSNKIKLSPMANARNAKNSVKGKEAQIGFDRIKFVKTCEKSFDSAFDYKRSQHLTFSHYHTMKNQMRNTAKNVALNMVRDVPMVKEYRNGVRVVNVISGLTKSKDPLEVLSAAFRQVPGARNCIKAINYTYNPSKIVLDIGKKVITTALNAGSL